MALAETLLALAATAGTGLVSAATTDAWESTKAGFARIFSRDDPKRVPIIESRLEATRAAIGNAAPAEVEDVRRQEESLWTMRFTDLIEEYPEAVPTLRSIVDSLPDKGDGIATALGIGSLAVGGNMSNRASTGGVAAGVINGPISTSNPPMPDQSKA